MKRLNDIFTSYLPKLDLHGEDSIGAKVRTNDFIMENAFLHNDQVVIIHGIGDGIVKNIVHETLKNNKHVNNYKQDNFNPGCTIVYLIVDNNVELC